MRFFSIFCGLILMVVSCRQAASHSEARVVEQSRRERPDWVGPDQSKLVKSGEIIEYHSVKTKVVDLPLGLKQAEASALNDTRLQIQNEIVLFWKKDKLFLELEAPDRALVTQQLEKLLETRVTSDLIKDIYYEKIFDPNAVAALQDTYSIHVLIQLKRSSLQGLLTDLQKYCRNSLRQGLIKLAQSDQVFSTQP
ncbi:MAG TPA: hypothetical protein VFO10_03675 [Oligoflexus sp.]|uniref:hypothetical protein n=1 Tax=Oligoflexus sp. TaxID=1971216 RepID=UPI002D8028C2|nr:hypothetical protein [Oligoflexus sp.]HET9236318.1 hypothetical protein [Oligoflexus sp.]